MAKRQSSQNRAADARLEPAKLRIIGGRHRGRTLIYSGDPRTRPMKDRVREAVFNLLADSVIGKHALDLFAGTGALSLEAISRGATRATMLERHFPTAQLIRDNAVHLGVAEQVEVVAANAFYWVKKQWQPDEQAVVVFCCPPYAFYTQREEEMLELLDLLATRSAVHSALVIECDERFDLSKLPANITWDVRRYAPAIIAIGEVPAPKDSAAV